MLFNPLFIQSTGQADASSSVKQSKFSSPTYLFSDIIKIINENTIGETSVASTAGSLATTASTTGSLATTNVAEAGTNSSESMVQLLALAENKSGTDNINISLNDLLKNLLISSNSEQVSDPKQVDNSSKKSTISNKLTSSLSKADVKKLLQSLAASLLQLNISPDSLQQVKLGNSSPDSTNQDNTDLNNSLISLNQSGNTIAELIINLPKDSKQIETSKDTASNQQDALASLYKTISSILANFTSNVPSENAGKTTTNDSKSDSTSQEVSPEVEQFAAALINLYQNNNNLVVNINFGDNNIKIEISNDTTSSDQTINLGSGAALNTQDQADSSIKTVQQSVPKITSDNTHETPLEGNAAIAAATVSKAKESISADSEEITKPIVVKTQAAPNNISDNNVTILSNQNDSINQVTKPNITDTTGLKSEDKVTITISSKLSDTDSQTISSKLSNTDSQTISSKLSDTDSQTVSSKLINADSQKTDVKVVTETKAQTQTQTVKGDLDNVKIAGDNEAANTVTPKGNEVKVSKYNEMGTTVKQDPIISDNKTIDDTEVKINSSTVSKNPVKNNLDSTAKAKNIANEPEPTVDVQSTEDVTAQNFNSSSKEVTKEPSGHSTQKAVQVNQAGVVNRQSDNSSSEFTDDTVSVKQSSNEEVTQVMNNKQGSSFSDQQQKKPSDNGKNSDIKAVEQIVSDFSTKTTDSVKEKFVSQTTSAKSPEKTIKITEITKEISNIIQQNTSKSVVLQLKPESLGKIKVTVDVTNNAVTARIVVDTEAVKQIVQNNTSELRQSLNLNGMQLSSISVNVSGGDQKPYQPHAQKKKSGYQSSEKRIEDNASLASAKSLGYNTYEYLI